MLPVSGGVREVSREAAVDADGNERPRDRGHEIDLRELPPGLEERDDDQAAESPDESHYRDLDRGAERLAGH